MDMSELNLEDYEIVPPPENETPRQFLLRVAGFDYTALDGLSWQDVREAGLMDTLTNIVARVGKPSFILRRKEL